ALLRLLFVTHCQIGEVFPPLLVDWVFESLKDVGLFASDDHHHHYIWRRYRIATHTGWSASSSAPYIRTRLAAKSISAILFGNHGIPFSLTRSPVNRKFVIIHCNCYVKFLFPRSMG